jgi:hypothetical protein
MTPAKEEEFEVQDRGTQHVVGQVLRHVNTNVSAFGVNADASVCQHNM